MSAATDIYPYEEARSIAFMITEHFYGFGRVDVAMDPLMSVDGYDSARLDDIIRQIVSWRPVQYITGRAGFMNLELEVSEGVLIPRPETEELVNGIIDVWRGAGPVRILDIGTGSGAIAIALSLNMPAAAVDALDISQDAIAIARRNAAANSAKVNFIHADVLLPMEELQGFLTETTYDIIVSNPPYIPEVERSSMRDNVTRYEPAGALFVPDDDPLKFYREIGAKAASLLSPGGEVWFEVHENFAEDVARLMGKLGSEMVRTIKDINGKERIVRCRRN